MKKKKGSVPIATGIRISRNWRRGFIMTIICVFIMAGNIYGQGTRLSSFPLVTTDTGISLVCVSDSGGIYRDKLIPSNELLAYLYYLGTGLITLDYVLGNGNATDKAAIFGNGSSQVTVSDSNVVVDYGTNLLTLNASDLQLFNYLTHATTTLTDQYLDVAEPSGYHGIMRDTSVFLTDAGGNARVGFNMVANMPSWWISDPTGAVMSFGVGNLTTFRNWWWRDKSDTVAGLLDILNDTGILATIGTLYRVVDSGLATTGTVTSVATGYGIKGGTITATGTLIADTSVLATRLRMMKSVDSVAGLSGGGSVTSVGTGYGLSGGAITSAGTLIADTSVLATRLRMMKSVDSVAGLSGGGTVNSVGEVAGYGAIIGGTSPITTAGTYTVTVDSSKFATKNLLYKVADSVASLTTSNEVASYYADIPSTLTFGSTVGYSLASWAPSVTGAYVINSYIKIKAITGTVTVGILVDFTDVDNVGQTLFVAYPVGGTSLPDSVGFYMMPSTTIRAKGGTNIYTYVNLNTGTTGSTMSVEAGDDIIKQ